MAVSDALKEATQLALLRATGLLETPPEESFDRLTRLATRLLDVPVATVTLIDAERQFFVSCVGVGEPWKSERGTPLSHSFCQYVVSAEEALVVDDARGHPLVGDNPAIAELGVIAYAGMPLRTSNGIVLGSFCAIDHKPRHWTESDLDALRTLADAAVAELELRVSSRELAERESRFRGALENVRAFATTVDVSGRITFVNDYFVEMTGWSREELVGADWFDLMVPSEDREARRTAFKTVMHGGFSSHNEAYILLRSGERRLVSWDNILLRDSSGGNVGVAALGHDITAQHQTARLKDELIALVSHELRGPLTAMRGGLKLMTPHIEKLDPQSRRLFDMAVRNGERLMRLVNDLLDLERIDRGNIPMVREKVGLRRLLDDACETTHGIAEAACVTIKPDAQDATIEVDPDRIVQVLTNLLTNAIKFSPKDSSVCVTAAIEGDDAHFVVIDHGRGIPPEQLESVFDRFTQVEADDAKKMGGAGLGLSIARAIVMQHGGRIWAESGNGKGATFHFTVPVEPVAE